MKDYLSVADTAKLIRKDLAKLWPDVKFYVRSKSYSGGASINVYYDGLDHYDPPLSCSDHGAVASKGDTYCPRDGYAGRWTPVMKPGAPASGDVDSALRVYSGSGFDGMIDMAYPIYGVRDAAGNVIGTTSDGTGGSHGSVPGWGTPVPDGGSLVSFGSSYVFVNDTLPYGVGS